MPSSGPCVTCKQRRIKCDGDWPICQRCEKSARDCLRPNPNTLTVVSENKYAAGRIKRPRGPRLRRATAPTTVIQVLHSKALKNYLDDHVLPPTDSDLDISGSLSACILAWQKAGYSSKMVELALLSMSLAVYARTKSHPEAATEAFSTYHELLKLTQVDVARPTLDVTSINSCLLTVFLMGRYESTMHNVLMSEDQGTMSELKNWSHHDGAMALLKLWQMRFRGQEMSVIVKQTRRGMLKSLLLRKMSVPEWLREGGDFGEQGLELQYDRILVRLVSIRWELHQDKSLATRESRLDLSYKVTRLAVDFVDIKDHLPKPLSFYEHEPADTNRLWFQTSRLQIYSTSAQAVLWAHILATRLLIASTNMTILRQIPDTKGEMDVCSKVLHQVANDLAATIPQCIGLVDQNDAQITINTAAHLRPSQVCSVGWPLSIAANMHGYYEDLRRGFKSQLFKLGETIGDGILQSVSTEDWPLL